MYDFVVDPELAVMGGHLGASKDNAPCAVM